MADNLNNGPGICRGTHRLVVKPVLAAISLGSGPDVLKNALQAIHHLNRRGDHHDLIAVALPLMGKVGGAASAGHELEAVGSEASLRAFVGSDLVRMMSRRGLLEPLEVDTVDFERGNSGVAYVRDRSPEKHTAGWIRRSEARAARRAPLGKTLGKPVKVRSYDSSKLVSLSYGEVILHVKEIVLPFIGEPIIVNTYGFSTKEHPSVLPVAPLEVKLPTQDLLVA